MTRAWIFISRFKSLNSRYKHGISERGEGLEYVDRKFKSRLRRLSYVGRPRLALDPRRGPKYVELHFDAAEAGLRSLQRESFTFGPSPFPVKDPQLWQLSRTVTPESRRDVFRIEG